MDLSTKVSKKMRLEDFLRQNLDAAPSPRIIEWVDRDAGIFRILWTHQSSGTFHHDDAALFRYWALARGKSTLQSSVELKQSLRMALNKSPSVERLPSEPLKPDYRFFRFVGTNRPRSRPGKQRSLRGGACGEPPAAPQRPHVDTPSLALWPDCVGQEEPINLSLGATKTNDEKRFNSLSNFLGKQGNIDAMDFNSCGSGGQFYSVNCKENIHCSLCATHAMNNLPDMVPRKNECRNCGNITANENNGYTDYHSLRPTQHQETVYEKPLFRPYALGNTTSERNVLFNKGDSYYRSEDALAPQKLTPYEQFPLFTSPTSADLEVKDTINNFCFLSNIEDEYKYFTTDIKEDENKSFPGAEYITEGYFNNSKPGYFHSLLYSGEESYSQA